MRFIGGVGTGSCASGWLQNASRSTMPPIVFLPSLKTVKLSPPSPRKLFIVTWYDASGSSATPSSLTDPGTTLFVGSASLYVYEKPCDTWRIFRFVPELAPDHCCSSNR